MWGEGEKMREVLEKADIIGIEQIVFDSASTPTKTQNSNPKIDNTNYQ